MTPSQRVSADASRAVILSGILRLKSLAAAARFELAMRPTR